MCRKLRKDHPELAPDVDLAQPPADFEPETAKPTKRKKRRSKHVGMDVDATDVGSNAAVDHQSADITGSNMDNNGSDIGHANEPKYRGGAEAMFLDSNDDADDDDLTKMVGSLN